MDNTIRIITDSGCDISKENEEKYKGLLEIMPFMVTIQGKSYVDRQDIQAEEFYKVLKEQQEIPKHSQITAIQFEDKYRELYAQGVRTIIVDVINGAGSQTYSNAQLAKQNVADELKDLTVYVVDSQNYTLAYGYPVIEACKKLEAGQSAESVVSYLEDWARHSEAFIVGFDLRHMKKSGRITAAASFLGELMGLKPLIYLAAEKTEVLRKARGDGSGLIYGMGHAVYTMSDPRAQILKTHAKSLAYKKGYDEEYELLCSIERLAPQVFAEEKHGPKKVCANVDLFSGLIYRMLGISEDLYTPLFAIARVPGWCAHRVEEVEFANRIIRPAYKYLGKPQEYVPLEKR